MGLYVGAPKSRFGGATTVPFWRPRINTASTHLLSVGGGKDTGEEETAENTCAYLASGFQE